MRLSRRSTASRSSSTSRTNSAARKGVTSRCFSSVRNSATFPASAGRCLLRPRGSRAPGLGHAMRGDVAEHPAQIFFDVPAQIGRDLGNSRCKAGIALHIRLAPGILAFGQDLQHGGVGQADRDCWRSVLPAQRAAFRRHRRRPRRAAGTDRTPRSCLRARPGSPAPTQPEPADD